ncbi:NPCBM-associated, NEW3 domain of alpha-galactosidase [Candidatus Burarchaeum australiense]|nr:NPCBM-associated, NEW3 domain of alpha-galactosidase [Candidatus Burarchaeum australiense]
MRTKDLRTNNAGTRNPRALAIVPSVLFVLLIFLSGLAQASTVPKVVLEGYSLTPDPAHPGDLLNLTLHLKSVEWDNCASQLTVQFSTAYPLSVTGANTIYAGDLCYKDPDSKGTISVFVPVDSLADPGTYPISVTATYEQFFSKISDSYIVNVRVAGTPSFTASVSSSNPVDIYPGDTALLTVAFANNGTGRAEGVQATFNSGTSAMEVKWAGQTQELGELQARTSTSATLAIEIPKNARPGTYPLAAQLTYAGEDGAIGTASFNFGVVVKSKAEFEAKAATDSPLPSGGNRLVQISLTNTGYEEAKNLKVQIMPRFPFSTDGTVRYLDSLAPGETKNITYTVFVDKDASEGAQLLSLNVNFEDPAGNKFSDSADFALSVRIRSFMEQVLDYWYLLALVGVVVLVVILRRMMAAAAKGRGKKGGS